MVKDWLIQRDYDPEACVLISLGTTGLKPGRDKIMSAGIIRGTEPARMLICSDVCVPEHLQGITGVTPEITMQGLPESQFMQELDQAILGVEFVVTYAYEKFTKKWFESEMPPAYACIETIDVVLLANYVGILKGIPADVQDIAGLHARMCSSAAAKVPNIDTICFERTGFLQERDKIQAINRVNQVGALWTQLKDML